MTDILRRVMAFAIVLVRPSYWLMNHPYSALWDAELRWLLDNGYTFEDITQHRARIGEYVVWIENHPYASFEIAGLRPSRLTIMRAHRVLMAARFDAIRFVIQDSQRGRRPLWHESVESRKRER